MLFRFEEAEAVLSALQRIWDDAPLELDVQFGIVPGPDRAPSLYISPTWCGEASGAEAALAPLYALNHRTMAEIRDQPFGQSRTFFDKHIVKGLVTTADTAWLRVWNAETSRIVVDAMRNRPSPLCFVLGHHCSGAATSLPPSATAFACREQHVWFEAIAPTDPQSLSDGSAEAAWAYETVERLAAYSLPGGYSNMLGARGADRARLGFGENASRLIAAKRRYDPENVFSSTIAIPR
jgi:FAD/FMN-containing dehydrogenase